MPELGIIDLQGGVAEHLEHFERLGVAVKRIKKPGDIPNRLRGLIIPGGESTCLNHLIRNVGLDESIRSLHAAGAKLWGTCAGAIILAGKVSNEEAKIPLIDIEIERNAFGSQLQSFAASAPITRISDQPVPLVFIRAPKIVKSGKDVDILLQHEGYIAMAESESVLVSVFHPELTSSLAVHRYFAEKCGVETKEVPDIVEDSTVWDITSWTKHSAVPET